MSTRILRRGHDPIEILERILNKTTLTTQRVHHGQIIDIGTGIHDDIEHQHYEEKTEAVKRALEEAEARATRELRAALKRLRKQMLDEKAKALEEQKLFYEELARKVAEARDRAEEERMRELTKKLQKEKEEALRKQWEECERLKEIAIKEACEELEKRLRDEFALTKELAVAEALKHAREKFRIRELESVAKMKSECEEKARKEAERVKKLHEEEIARHENRYDILRRKYNREIDHKERVEKDFNELQTDYCRFMDYTGGQYHSDYMIRVRNHGMRLAKKRTSVVTYEDIERLELK